MAMLLPGFALSWCHITATPQWPDPYACHLWVWYMPCHWHCCAVCFFMFYWTICYDCITSTIPPVMPSHVLCIQWLSAVQLVICLWERYHWSMWAVAITTPQYPYMLHISITKMCAPQKTGMYIETQVHRMNTFIWIELLKNNKI